MVFMIPIWIAFLQSHISVSQIAIYVSVTFLTQLVMELPTGALADLIGRRMTITLSYLVDAIHYVLLGFAWLFPQFIVLAVISGLGEALRSGSLEAIVYDSLKQDKREGLFQGIMAKQGTRFQVGLVFSTVLGGFMVSWWGPLPFVASGAFLLMAAVISLQMIEPWVDSEKFTLRNYLRQIKWGAREAFRTISHRSISMYYIAVGSITWMCATYLNDYVLVDLGFAAEQRGIISAGLRLLNVTLLYKLLTNEKLFNFRRTIVLFPILMIVSLTPGWWLGGYWGVPFVGMAMMASTARWMLLGKYTNAVFNSKYRATAISTLSMAISIIYVVAITASGPIMERWGDSRLMYSLLGILSLLTIPPLAYRVLKHYA